MLTWFQVGSFGEAMCILVVLVLAGLLVDKIAQLGFLWEAYMENDRH